MKQHKADYKVVPLQGRRTMAFAMRSVQNKPMIHGLIEVDVTRTRSFLREYKAKTGESLSFISLVPLTIWLILIARRRFMLAQGGSLEEAKQPALVISQ